MDHFKLTSPAPARLQQHIAAGGDVCSGLESVVANAVFVTDEDHANK
jgi:hypothetical protein